MRHPRGLVGLLALLLPACDAASSDPALDALLQVEGAQWRPGALPDDAGGPEVVTALSLRPTVTSSTIGERFRGALEPDATGLIIGLDGDAGAWIVTAGLPEVDTPDLPSFSVLAGIGAIEPGPIAIDFIAVDRDGRAGPATRLNLVADDIEPPTGELVVSLAWSGAADLDIHVIDPEGAEIWSGDANSWDPPPPGTPPDPDAWMTGGILQRDANADCARDGAPREDVIWAMTPPSGEYTVRVDAQSLCGDAAAEWYAAAWQGGDLVHAVRGRSGPSDTRFPHGAGAGALAFRFTVPWSAPPVPPRRRRRRPRLSVHRPVIGSPGPSTPTSLALGRARDEREQSQPFAPSRPRAPASRRVEGPACLFAILICALLVAPARADEPATLRGTIRDAAGEPVAGVIVQSGADLAASGDDGAYELALPAGKHTLDVTAPWIVDQQLVVRLRAGEQRTLDLTVVDDLAKLAQEVIEVIDVAPVTPGSSRVDASLARAVPGASGDAGKAVQSLPAVARPPPGSSDIVVWGASPRDTRVFVDGVPVPALYHLAGWRSAVGNELVGDLSLHAAAFGIERGGAIGGVIDVATRDPADAPRAVLAADVIDVAAFGRGTAGDASIGGGARASWLDRAVGAVADVEVEEVAPLPQWADAQLVARIPLRAGLEARAMVLVSADRLDRTVPSDDPAAVRTEQIRRGFVRVAAGVRRELDDGLAEALVYVGADADRRALQFGDVPAELDVDTLVAGARAFHRARLTHAVGLSVGVDLAAERASASRAGSLTIPAREGDGGVFGQPPGDDVASDDWRATTVDAAPLGRVDLVSRRGAVSLGARLDTWLVTASHLEPKDDRPGLGWQTVVVVPSPRVSAVGRITDALSATAEAGRYSQARAASDASAVFGTPTLTVERAWHVTGGLAWSRAPVTLELAAFARWLDDLVARAPGATPRIAHALTQDGVGRTTGAQLTARVVGWRGVTGWVSYTFTRSQRTDADGALPRRFDQDQPHGATAVVAWDHGPWSAGVRVRYATGQPRTPVTGAFFDSRTGRYQPITGRINVDRLPAFFQLDLRGERRIDLGGARASLYLELQNATARANAEELAYSADYSDHAYITGLPLLAVLGARIEL